MWNGPVVRCASQRPHYNQLGPNEQELGLVTCGSRGRCSAESQLAEMSISSEIAPDRRLEAAGRHIVQGSLFSGLSC